MKYLSIVKKIEIWAYIIRIFFGILKKIESNMKIQRTKVFSFPRVYEYRPRISFTVLGFFLFILAATTVLYSTLVPQFPSGPTGKKIALAIITAFAIKAESGGINFVVIFIQWIASFFKKNYVVVTRKKIVCPPKSIFSDQTIIIPYKEIISLDVQVINGARNLCITSVRGRIVLRGTLLRKKEFYEICTILKKLTIPKK
jgi:hypothetical protein